ncbi:MAG: family NAD(P)-dependent oxidoreductase [Frankiales bacterium]|jgi:NAD(P)-dependent dehydrogenase (short-subunit alcohol dehydrogenase family)|nr:family NAD(P)-dependent oxidoreductase [Frankiales bacterium]
MSKQALVTGGSRGIGKAIALALAENGYDVAIAARTLRASDPTPEHSQTIHKQDVRPLPGSVEETAEAVEKLGQKALPLKMDLTDLASVESAIKTLLDEWGGVDVVVNNGRHIGPGLMDTIAETPIEQYPLFMMAHGVAPIRITQLLAPAMIARGGGTFVTISSGAGYEFYPEQPKPGLGYRIGKASGHTLVGSIQAEYGDQGINAYNVNPGFVLTERNSLDVEEFGFDPAWAGPPAAVGAAVAWLVTSPEAPALQRQNLDAQPLALERNLYPDWRPKAS